jgi:hypothetical protein
MADTSISDLLMELRARHRRRNYAMNQRKSIDNQLGAMVRSQCGWALDLPKVQRDGIKEHAAALIKTCESHARLAQRAMERGTEPPDPPPDFGFIMATIAARAPFDGLEASETKSIEALAQQLPIWPRFADVRGLGALGVGMIHAEAASDRPELAGLYPDYERVSKLYKRLGLAVFDGYAQGRVPSSMPAAQRAQAWKERGYNPSRRSKMWSVGSSLIKLNGDDGRYRGLYLRRKSYERERAEAKGIHVVTAAKILKGREGEFISLKHIDLRAQRVMEKQLVEDLWNAWREASWALPELANVLMPSAAHL